jgi:ERI1 exoribonuclease 2
VIYSDKNARPNSSIQPFDYLLVLDFEATCWNNLDSKKKQSEIIEFPVVLYDVKNNEIVAEFQQYVIPTEHPKLSDFCIQLTGIQQNQVDNGVPLPTCLLEFMRWINEQMKLYNMDFPGGKGDGTKTCAFVTWSDWDLGVCLKKECNRKRIHCHKMFRKWIDVRALYKLHFKRPLTGLSGALLDLGLQFEGKEHCGLHDARNTARLVGKMIEKGVILRLTKN